MVNSTIYITNINPDTCFYFFVTVLLVCISSYRVGLGNKMLLNLHFKDKLQQDCPTDHLQKTSFQTV